MSWHLSGWKRHQESCRKRVPIRSAPSIWRFSITYVRQFERVIPLPCSFGAIRKLTWPCKITPPTSSITSRLFFRSWISSRNRRLSYPPTLSNSRLPEVLLGSRSRGLIGPRSDSMRISCLGGIDRAESEPEHFWGLRSLFGRRGAQATTIVLKGLWGQSKKRCRCWLQRTARSTERAHIRPSERFSQACRLETEQKTCTGRSVATSLHCVHLPSRTTPSFGQGRRTT